MTKGTVLLTTFEKLSEEPSFSLLQKHQRNRFMLFLDDPYFSMILITEPIPISGMGFASQ